MTPLETNEAPQKNPAQSPMDEAFEAAGEKYKQGSEVNDSYLRERIEGQGYTRCEAGEIPTAHYNNLLRDLRQREKKEGQDWIPGAEASSESPIVRTNQEKGVEVSTYYKVICNNNKGEYVIAKKSEERAVEVPADIKEFIEANLDDPKAMDMKTPNSREKALAIIRAVKSSMSGKPAHIILDRKDIIQQGFAASSDLPPGSSAIVVADKSDANKARIYFGELKS